MVGMVLTITIGVSQMVVNTSKTNGSDNVVLKETFAEVHRKISALTKKVTSDEDVIDELTQMLKARDQLEIGPIQMMDLLESITEDGELERWPIPGSTARKGNQLWCDKFSVTNSSDSTQKVEWYYIMALDFPQGQAAQSVLDELALVRVTQNGIQGPDKWTKVGQADRDAEEQMQIARIKACANVIRQAVGLHRSLGALREMPGVRVVVKRNEDGSVRRVQKPILVVDVNEPDQYQNCTVKSFLRYDVDAAKDAGGLDEKGTPKAGLQHLRDTVKRDQDEDKGEVDIVGNILSETSWLKTLPSFSSWLNQDKNWARIRKLLSVKGSDPMAYDLYVLYTRLSHYMEKEQGLERGERIDKEYAAETTDDDDEAEVA